MSGDDVADLDPFDPSKNPWSSFGAMGLVLAALFALLKGSVYSKGSHAELMAGQAERIKERDAQIVDLKRENEVLQAAVERMRDDRDQWRLAAYGEVDRHRRSDPQLPQPPIPRLSLPDAGLRP